MGYIKFTNSQGPFGDCTCNYDIDTDAITVGDFIDAILNNATDDSTITVMLDSSDRKAKDVAVAEIVKRNVDKFKIERVCANYDEYKNCKIDSIKANGGYGMMSYRIYTKDRYPIQDRDEYFFVHFGSYKTYSSSK